LLAFSESEPELFPRDAAQELAALLDVEGILDGLSDADARHVVIGVVVNILNGTGPIGLARQSAAVARRPKRTGADAPAAVARALSRTSALIHADDVEGEHEDLLKLDRLEWLRDTFELLYARELAEPGYLSDRLVWALHESVRSWMFTVMKVDVPA
jgi:hypothetical protein